MSNDDQQKPADQDADARARWATIAERRSQQSPEDRAKSAQEALDKVFGLKPSKKVPQSTKTRPKVLPWTGWRKRMSQPGSWLDVKLNPESSVYTKNIAEQFEGMSGPWQVVRHTEQRLIVENNAGNRLFLAKVCGNTSNYLWVPQGTTWDEF